jgi:hypothetical protein
MLDLKALYLNTMSMIGRYQNLKFSFFILVPYFAHIKENFKGILSVICSEENIIFVWYLLPSDLP